MADLIDRQAALDAIKAWYADYPLELQEPIDDCWNSVRELPAVQPDHIADIGKKAERTFCSNCRNEAPEGKINSDCLMCMHLYGVHTQEANIEAAYESINFPKRDLFEPKKGIADTGKKVERTAETAHSVQDGDLINRKAALEAYGDWYCEEGPEEGFIGTVGQLLKMLPPAQPERKKGTWIPFDIPWYRCSECGAVRENIAFMEYFCPNCGADLRGEQDDR